MNLSDHFGKFTCKTLKHELGITTVEDAIKLSDETLMKYRGIGRMFCYHLRQLETKIPSGERVEKIHKYIHMFILRRLLGEEGVESNTILGDSYNVVYKTTHPTEFKRAWDAFYGPGTAEVGDYPTVAFITYNDGSRVLPLYKGQASYIMTESGTTFSGRLTMREGDADVPTSK